MACRPDSTELRHATAVLDTVDSARSVGEFLTLTLEALDEHVGIRRSAFMLGLTEGRLPGPAAYAGLQHGLRPHVLEEYFERWFHLDALTTDVARAAYARDGRATIDGIYSRLGAANRRYIDEFLRRNGDEYQLSFRLAGAGWSDGYLTLADSDAPDERAQRIIAMLVPALTERLRRRLPRGIDGVLSARESQVAELVAQGFPNRAIATIMSIEEDTVKKHLAHAAGKLGVRGRTQLAVCWSSGQRLDLPVHPAARSAPTS
jgi:DNA-binding CsgD family transcriptional regulator